MMSIIVNHLPEKLRYWVEKVLEHSSSRSGFEVLRRLKLVPPIGVSQEGLEEDQWISERTRQIPHYKAYLLAGNTTFWKSWLDRQKLEAG